MKAIVIREPGGPETLSYEELPDPESGPGEVLVRVRAANADLLHPGDRGPRVCRRGGVGRCGRVRWLRRIRWLGYVSCLGCPLERASQSPRQTARSR
jgi:hypothetical protein